MSLFRPRTTDDANPVPNFYSKAAPPASTPGPGTDPAACASIGSTGDLHASRPQTVVRQVSQAVFDLADSDHDGAITRDEYVRLMNQAFGLPTDEMGEAFDSAAADGTARLRTGPAHGRHRPLRRPSRPNSPP